MRKVWYVSALVFWALFFAALTMGCEGETEAPEAIQKVNTVKITKGADGLTNEQRNIYDRVKEENKAGNIQHLYIISAYSGEVIMYSSVKGKVTSSGKRLQPTALTGNGDYGGSYYEVNVRGRNVNTAEVMQDDGTYGDSVPYLYWWDQYGAYHQQYIQGGMILHISGKPLRVSEVAIKLDQK